jgi:hypothetical protein
VQQLENAITNDWSNERLAQRDWYQAANMPTRKIHILIKMLLKKSFAPGKHTHFNSLLNRPILVDAQMMGHTNVRISQGRILWLKTFLLTGLDGMRSWNGSATGCRA